MLIYCVSKLNWRTDAWLQCNKNKVPLLNSLTCFFIISIIIFIFLFHFPSPHVHASSVTAHGSYTHSEPARGGVAAGVGPGAQTPVGFSEILGAPAGIRIHSLKAGTWLPSDLCCCLDYG